MDREAVSQLHTGGRDQSLTLLDSLVEVAQEIERGENESSAEGRESSLLSITLISLCIAISSLVRNVNITQENDRAIFTAMKAVCQIFEKLHSDKNVYHNLLDRALRSLRVVLHPTTTEILPEVSKENSIHCVLHNLAREFTGNVLDLLDVDYSNFENSQLSPLLESLNCTLGSLKRALDPLPGGKYAMEAELYNAHLTPGKFPIVATRISEPTVSYCCNSYRQLPPPRHVRRLYVRHC